MEYVRECLLPNHHFYLHTIKISLTKPVFHTQQRIGHGMIMQILLKKFLLVLDLTEHMEWFHIGSKIDSQHTLMVEDHITVTGLSRLSMIRKPSKHWS